METVRCNSCGGKDQTIIWDKITSWEHPGEFTLVECRSCSLRFINPRPEPSEMGQYYPTETYWGEDASSQVSKRNSSYAHLYHPILANISKGRILDIGAGTGLFLSGLKELGWQTEGVEFSSAAVKFGKKHFGLSLKTGDFLDFKFPDKFFDVITLNNALEHLHDPMSTLAAIEKTLKPGGLLLITVPNAASLGWKIFGPGWYALQTPRHLYHFTPHTLCTLIQKNGFEIQDINHWYWIHNYFALFESFRMRFSPRFAQSADTKLTKKSRASVTTQDISLKKEVGKIVFKVLSATLALLGSIIGHGETIRVSAVKVK